MHIIWSLISFMYNPFFILNKWNDTIYVIKISQVYVVELKVLFLTFQGSLVGWLFFGTRLKFACLFWFPFLHTRTLWKHAIFLFIIATIQVRFCFHIFGMRFWYASEKYSACPNVEQMHLRHFWLHYLLFIRGLKIKWISSMD